ncbi:MAG: hypothetical protein ACAI38_09050 [Myxococcota bacterium]
MDEWWQALGRLAEKYRELASLCAERDELERNGVFQLDGPGRQARHARTRSLARRFPGALRELDGATVKGLLARLQEIEEELALRRAREASPRWMRVVDDFHGELRGLLAIKGARGRGEAVTEEELERIADPPYGRLQELVWSRLAERYGLLPEELRAIVHGG